MEDPVQVCRGNVTTLGKTNDLVPLAHTPIVPPLARVSVLHGHQKSAKTIGETAILTISQEA